MRNKPPAPWSQNEVTIYYTSSSSWENTVYKISNKREQTNKVLVHSDMCLVFKIRVYELEFIIIM